MLSRTAKTVKTAKTVMKATPLKPNPPFSVILSCAKISRKRFDATPSFNRVSMSYAFLPFLGLLDFDWLVSFWRKQMHFAIFKLESYIMCHDDYTE